MSKLLFFKEICNWKLFSLSLMYQIQQHQFQYHNVLFVMLANALHLKKWFQSFIHNVHFSKTQHWFKSYLSPSSSFPVLPHPHNHHVTLPCWKKLYVPRWLSTDIYKNCNWHPQGIGESTSGQYPVIFFSTAVIVISVFSLCPQSHRRKQFITTICDLLPSCHYETYSLQNIYLVFHILLHAHQAHSFQY